MLTLTEEDLTLQQAFSLADTILRQGVQGISEVIVVPGLVNLDFNDVKAVMKDAGTAMMGIFCQRAFCQKNCDQIVVFQSLTILILDRNRC